MSKYSSYILYLLISVLIVILYVNNFGPMEHIQQNINDIFCRMTASEETRPNVVMVTIDEKTQEQYGAWPWNYDKIADLLAATAAGEPKAIVLNLDLSEETKQDTAGYTSILAEQMSWIKNVVVPYDIVLANYRVDKTNNPKYLFNYSVKVNNPLGLMSEESSLLVRKVFLPSDKILESKPLLGFTFNSPDDDKILRHQAMVMQYEGYYYPSLPLIAAAAYMDVPTNEIEIFEGQEIKLGSRISLPIDDHGEYYINCLPNNSFVAFSGSDILSDDFNRTQLANKLVIIDVKNSENWELLATPIDNETPKPNILATVIENIINNNQLVKARSNNPVIMMLLFGIGGLCAFFLPRLKLAMRLTIIGSGLLLLTLANYYMFGFMRIMPDSIYLAMELILFMVAAPMLDSQLITGEIAEEEKEFQKRKSDIKKSEEFIHQPIVREIKDNPRDQIHVCTEAVDFNAPNDHQAIDIDKEYDSSKLATTALDGNKKEASTEAIMKMNDSNPEIISPDSYIVNNSNDSIVTSETPIKKGKAASGEIKTKNEIMPLPTGAPPNLGRYQVTGTLGKGAMGMVYMGLDPAINRPVALKTIRLDFVNDPSEMEDLKERLFREAQAAGKLSHPNIVTIYDVGSEDQLQYIAMEYLEGETLEDMIKRKTNFNYKIIAQIIIQICSALNYAHEQGIVHRDIKPANIMILKDYRVKVMDYGIARIDSSSMTKTGIAMGTPNYISPEQLKGQPTDQRADLFSLGVVIYEMLLGKRPFKGENITSLIYSIMHHEPPKPSDLNPQIPLLFDRIIFKALEKNPDARFQKASEIVTILNDFVESFAPER
ncbi:MAG: serine/threonine-protein kinase [bacterium]